jgi:hypothetical protein
VGYNIFSYAVYFDRTVQVIGSKNQEIFEEIQVTDTFKLYERQELEDHVTIEDALYQLIFGEPYNVSSAHCYWYAFIALCAHEGEEFLNVSEINVGYETDLIDTHLKNDFGIHLNIESLLLNGSPITSLPPVVDWPQHGILFRPALLSLQEQLKDIHITDDQLDMLLEEDEDDKELAYQGIQQLKRKIDFCVANEMELISFCH